MNYGLCLPFLLLCLVNTVSNGCHQPFWSDGTTGHSSQGWSWDSSATAMIGRPKGQQNFLFEDVNRQTCFPTKFPAQCVPQVWFCKWAKPLVVINLIAAGMNLVCQDPHVGCCKPLLPSLSLSVSQWVSPHRFPWQSPCCVIIIRASHKLTTMPKVLWLSPVFLFSPWRLRGSLSIWCCAGLRGGTCGLLLTFKMVSWFSVLRGMLQFHPLHSRIFSVVFLFLNNY